jgi:hypothetical protein
LDNEIIKNGKIDFSDIYNSNNDIPSNKDLGIVDRSVFKFRENGDAKKYIESIDPAVSKEIINKLNEYNKDNNLH